MPWHSRDRGWQKINSILYCLWTANFLRSQRGYTGRIPRPLSSQPYPLQRQKKDQFALSELYVFTVKERLTLEPPCQPKNCISYKQGFHGEISTQTVSRWISQAVIWSYAASARSPDLLRLHSVKAHEVRAYSASVALLRAVPLEDILKAACWKCHNTFTSHYLRDLTFESEELLCLGPLVASQKLIQV